MSTNSNEIVYINEKNGKKAINFKNQVIGNGTNEEIKPLTIVIFGSTGGSGLEAIKNALSRGHKGIFKL
jgi:hypothetical protein